MKDFEEIYSEYYDTVFLYTLSLCKNEQLAEEITQNAFFKVLKSINTFQGDCKLSVWLCQIGKNTFYTTVRQQKRQTDHPLESVPSETSIEQKFLDKEAALQIHGSLHSLEEPYKEVFWMRTFGELSFKEIGVLFEKTESWARVTYHRAKLKIKEGVK